CHTPPQRQRVAAQRHRPTTAPRRRAPTVRFWDGGVRLRTAPASRGAARQPAQARSARLSTIVSTTESAILVRHPEVRIFIGMGWRLARSRS
ncbi:MAG: hypothetical protein AVDCRST_MAG11-3635, partial [uncultured Gemmatimonadaceae bacterium]